MRVSQINASCKRRSNIGKEASVARATWLWLVLITNGFSIIYKPVGALQRLDRIEVLIAIDSHDVMPRSGRRRWRIYRREVKSVGRRNFAAAKCRPITISPLSMKDR